MQRLRQRESVAARRVESLSPVSRSIALGVAPAPKSGYRIAVRVQRRSAAAETVPRIRKIAAREVDVRYVGQIAKLAGEPPPNWMTTRVRPLRIGASVGHFAITAGTIGAFVHRNPGTIADDGTPAIPADTHTQPLILSNNHVLANENAGSVGDAILQPGRYDGGTDADKVATLETFVTLDPAGTNLVDAALARVDEGIECDLTSLGDEVRLTGAIDLVESGLENVRKLGRTTGLTDGRITAFDLDNLVVTYERGNLRFDDQLEIESTTRSPFSRGGDSGSLIVTSSLETPAEGLAAGLLFAGSDQGGRLGLGLTYANPIAPVLSALDASLALDAGSPPEQNERVSTLHEARAAKERVKELLGERDELRGVGITRSDEGYALKVNLSERNEVRLPAEIDGVPVQVEIVGEVRALRTTRVTRRRQPSQSSTDRG